jgi:hypothetical protein
VEVPADGPGKNYFLRITTASIPGMIDFDPLRPFREQTSCHKSGIQFIPFETLRCSHTFHVPMPTDGPVWDSIEKNAKEKAKVVMDARALNGHRVAAKPEVWPENVMRFGVDGGLAFLDEGTKECPLFRMAIGDALDRINEDTLGIVSDPDWFFLTMNAFTASKLGASEEVRVFMKSDTVLKEQLEKGEHPNNKFGLPSRLYVNILVDTSPGIADGVMLLATKVPRPKNEPAKYGEPSFSTLTFFHGEDEMTLETRQVADQSDNMRLIEDSFCALTCPASGRLMLNTVSPGPAPDTPEIRG